MTPAELKSTVSYRGHKDISSSGGDDDIDVESWVTQAIRYVQNIEDWTVHKDDFEITTSTTPALTAGTYKYAMRTLKSDFRKLQIDSVGYGSTPLTPVEEAEEIGRRIGRSWNASSTDSGLPRIVGYYGGNLILAPKPSSSFVSTSGQSINGFYYRSEKISDAAGDDAGDWKDETLLFPEDFYNDLVDVALIFALQQEDDSNFQTQLGNWERFGLSRLRGYDEMLRSEELLNRPLMNIEGGNQIF